MEGVAPDGDQPLSPTDEAQVVLFFRDLDKLRERVRIVVEEVQHHWFDLAVRDLGVLIELARSLQSLVEEMDASARRSELRLSALRSVEDEARPRAEAAGSGG